MMRFFLATLLLLAAAGAFAADHKEAPLIREDAAADIGDVYFFTSPVDPNNTVMIMTVNPMTPPSQNIASRFSPDARYQIRIDTDNDQVDDSVYSFEFQGASGTQSFTLELNGVEVASGNTTPPSVEPTPPAPVVVAGTNGEQVFAGQRDDPFFFDNVSFQRFLDGIGPATFAGNDGFAGFNVSALAIEVPTSVISNGSTNLQMYGATMRRRHAITRDIDGTFKQTRGPWEQIDRMGVPGVSTLFISSSRKDEYNYASPANDVNGDFLADFGSAFATFGTSAANQAILSGLAIPDTLKLDTTMPSGFPNGRRLQDDVIDIALGLATNSAITTDNVPANDVPFIIPPRFPYMAPANQP